MPRDPEGMIDNFAEMVENQQNAIANEVRKLREAQAPVVLPKEAKASIGEGSSMHRSSNAPPSRLSTFTPTMSFSSPIRHSARLFESWTCASCSRIALRLAHRRHTGIVRPRRCLNTTKEAKQSAAPSMDQIRAQYKEKNRTTMYEIRLVYAFSGL